MRDNVAASRSPEQPDAKDAASDDKSRYYPIRGQYLIIRYDEVRNLNIDYGISERVDTGITQETFTSSELPSPQG